MRRLALLLLVVATAFVAQPPDRLPTLPPLPASIWTTFGPVKVLRGHPVPCPENAPGCYNGLSRELYVDDSLPPVMQWRVLRHERVHVIFRDANIGFADPNVEDRIAHVIANFDVAELIAASESATPRRP